MENTPNSGANIPAGGLSPAPGAIGDDKSNNQFDLGEYLEGNSSPHVDGAASPHIDEAINHLDDQLIRDAQAKLESDITASYPLVSSIISVDNLHTDYAHDDEIYQRKVEDLKISYTSIRKTRPDGNCFFRAFIFSYFESLFGDAAEKKRFLGICTVTRKGIADVLGFPDFTIDEFYEYFFNVTQAILDEKVTTAEQLLNELNQPAVYDNIVVYLRLLTSYYLQKESEFFSNFIEGPGQIGDFCKREVEPMYKESDHIHITALSSVLEVTTRIVYMDRGAGGKVNEHDFSPLKAEGPPADPRVHLLYRPGHYDVLYSRVVDCDSSAQPNGTQPLSPGQVVVPSSPNPHIIVAASPAHPGHPEPDSSSFEPTTASAIAHSPGHQSDVANSTQPDL